MMYMYEGWSQKSFNNIYFKTKEFHIWERGYHRNAYYGMKSAALIIILVLAPVHNTFPLIPSGTRGGLALQPGLYVSQLLSQRFV
jgi:hypothetical protein